MPEDYKNSCSSQRVKLFRIR